MPSFRVASGIDRPAEIDGRGDENIELIESLPAIHFPHTGRDIMYNSSREQGTTHRDPIQEGKGVAMAYTFGDLRHKTVAQLRQIAGEIEHEAVKGYTQMTKEPLLSAICEALGVDMHEHHDVVGIDKRAIKLEFKELKKKRDQALEARDRSGLKSIRSQIHALKRKIHRATV